MPKPLQQCPELRSSILHTRRARLKVIWLECPGLDRDEALAINGLLAAILRSELTAADVGRLEQQVDALTAWRRKFKPAAK